MLMLMNKNNHDNSLLYPLFRAPDRIEGNSTSLPWIAQHLADVFLDNLGCFNHPFTSILLLGSAVYLKEAVQDLYPTAKVLQSTTIQAGDKVNCILALGLPPNQNSDWLVPIFDQLGIGGVFLLGTLGPDTYIEQEDLLNTQDLHTLGDRLLQAQFFAPVTSSVRMEFTYPNEESLYNDLNDLNLRPDNPYITEANLVHLHQLKERPSINSPRSLFLEFVIAHGMKQRERPVPIVTPIALMP